MKRGFSSEAGPGRLETILSWGIIALLGVVAVGVYVKQSLYVPGTWVPQEGARLPDGRPPPGDSGAVDFDRFLPSTLVPMGPPEAFGPRTLSDKIDGKAELYLPAGFVHLKCQRFKLTGVSTDWMEAFVYDMGSIRHAFAVFSAQRRSGATTLSLTPFSYETRNALFFVHGKHYVELVTSSGSAEIMDAAAAFAGRFVNHIPHSEERIEELALFPEEGLDAANRGLIVSDAFGYQELKDVFTAPYQVDDTEVTAFITKKAGEDEAIRLVAAYRDFLLQNGATIDETPPFQGAEMVRLFGTYEIFFPCGPYVAGVHQAERRGPAEELVARLRARLDAVCK